MGLNYLSLQLAPYPESPSGSAWMATLVSSQASSLSYPLVLDWWSSQAHFFSVSIGQDTEHGHSFSPLCQRLEDPYLGPLTPDRSE